jgi:methionine-rich copper-binding protein CopC
VRAIATRTACAAGIVIAALSLPAGAHAFLDHADPRVGATVSRSPAQVTVWFTERLEPAFSTLKVMDAAGNVIDAKDRKVDAGSMRVTIPKVLAPGKYRVEWRVLSVDTHVTQGQFTFEVAR